MNLRNVAIIAHVDHGKTTLVDGLLKQSHIFRDNESEMSQTLIMDSNDQERERGITILAKNTAVTYKDTKINIIDTPGHADFAGEVERTLNMADGAILVVDAQEGPMPQTKFVLKKALHLGLKIIVVINKIDKRDAQVDVVISKLSDLFLELATEDHHLDFPVYYAICRDGKAWEDMPQDMNESADLTPIFEAILKYVPEPKVDNDGTFQMLVTTLDADNYLGKYVIGRINRGVAKPGLAISLVNDDGIIENTRIEKVFTSYGLKRQEVSLAECGDIVALTGVKNAQIGQTIADTSMPEPLPSIEIEKPTLKMSISANTSPFAGKEGKYVTGRQLLDRIKKELETNVSLHLESNEGGEFIVAGRGELHLSVFIENLRREGYEMQVGKPQVITKKIDGVEMEPFEELTVIVAKEFTNNVIAEVNLRKGMLLNQEENADNTTKLDFEITTRGLLGLRNKLLTISKGTAIMSSLFLDMKPVGSYIPRLRNGALISSEPGKAVTYGLNNVQGRGITFIPPGTQVYEGMIIGLSTGESDIEMNVTKEKKLTNVRSSNADIAVALTPPTILSLEQSLDFLEDDELLEATPQSLRLRKKILNALARKRSR